LRDLECHQDLGVHPFLRTCDHESKLLDLVVQSSSGPILPLLQHGTLACAMPGDRLSLIDALRQDPVVELSIAPDVGLEIVARRWQNDPDAEITEALPFVIKGPTHVISLLQREGQSIESNFAGFLSPPHPITISGVRAQRAGIPPESAFYAFAYPMESLSGQYERLVGGREETADPWLLFLLLGGYCYFDADPRLIQTNALVMSPTGFSLSLAGPFSPSHAAVAGLGAGSRLRELTLLPLREKGLEHFAWINPGERPGGATLLANGGDLPNNGAFLYQAATGEAVVFSVINRSLLGVEDEAGDHTTPLTLSGRLSAMHRSGRIEAATQQLEKWKSGKDVTKPSAVTDQSPPSDECDVGRQKGAHAALLANMRMAADAADTDKMHELIDRLERLLAEPLPKDEKIDVSVIDAKTLEASGGCCALM
jgi:hypothetical protein